jgi:hypothetical protein
MRFLTDNRLKGGVMAYRNGEVAWYGPAECIPLNRGYEKVMANSKDMAVVKERLNQPAIDPRDPDPSREGIFRNHNCHRCQDGTKPCVVGAPHRCEFPHARND